MESRSIFEQNFDTAVFGGGYAALAVAWTLARAGKRIVLFDRGMGVAWESSRAFATLAGECGDPIWQDFLAELKARNLFRGGRIDCAGAEIVACARLRAQADGVRVLFGAFPLRADMRGGHLAALAVATKSGLRILRARNWIDASEEGALCKLAYPQSAAQARKPDGYQQRAVLVAQDAVEVSAASASIEGGGTAIEARPWVKEFAILTETPGPLALDTLFDKALETRGLLGDGLRDAGIVQFSVCPLPVYGGREASAGAGIFAAGNLWPASPSFASVPVRTLGERFGLGAGIARTVLAAGEVTAPGGGMQSRRMAVLKRKCDVLIAGVGTGGALAAATVLDEGGSPLIIDPASFSGGVGTGGLISGYFHGQPGGGFEQMDKEARQVQAQLDSVRRTDSQWHPESKKIVFERRLARMPEVFLREALVYAVEVRDQRIVSVRAVSAEADYEITPKTVIDATGDGDVAALAGAAFDFGRVGDGHGLAYSQPCLRLVRKDDSLQIRAANYDAGWVDPTDPEDLTRARLVGVVQQLRAFYQEEEHLLQVAPIPGLRQSRNIHTEQRVTLDDLIHHRRFAGSIGVAKSPLDTHSVDFEFEDDETLFWLWGCKNFRGVTFCDMPYGMLVPKGMHNLWLACRAAGISPPTAYALRMQRDLQRMGEAAAYAAMEAARTGVAAMDLPVDALRSKLEHSGALAARAATDNWNEDPLAQLRGGQPGGYLWTLYRDWKRYREAVAECLRDKDPRVSWLAAVVVAMWGDARAEPRLIQALAMREEGGPTPPSARGAHGQWIDVPNWFLAVNLLRCCGSEACLPALAQIAKGPGIILNLRTSVALTLARLGARFDDTAKSRAAAILRDLVADEAPDRIKPPSHSIYRALRGEAQKPLGNEPGWVDNREDQGWRVAYTVAKAARALGIPCPAEVDHWRGDERVLTRRAFQSLGDQTGMHSTIPRL